jgi:predicted nucleic acid-binding protein
LYLVDTSAWIGYLNEKENEAVARFVDVLDLGLPFGITGVAYGEVLRGARTPTGFERLKEYTSAQRFYHLRDRMVGYEEADRIYHCCRRGESIMLRMIDCPVARVAIEHDVVLPHDDSDFVNVGRIVSELKLV